MKRMGLIMNLAVSLLVAPFSISTAATYLILPDGLGDFPTIEAAFTQAAPGDTVELADGVFTGDGNRFLLLWMPVTLRSQSGNPEQCVIDCDGAGGAPPWLEVVSLADPYLLVVGGLTVTGSFARVLHVQGSTGQVVRIENCCFLDNPGGGPRYWGDGRVFIEDCLFENNAAESGGAIMFSDSGTPSETRVVSACRFRGNAATDFGGAIYYDEPVEYQIEDCHFEANTASLGSALFHAQFIGGPGGSTVTGCTFLANVGSQGAVCYSLLRLLRLRQRGLDRGDCASAGYKREYQPRPRVLRPGVRQSDVGRGLAMRALHATQRGVRLDRGPSGRLLRHPVRSTTWGGVRNLFR